MKTDAQLFIAGKFPAELTPQEQRLKADWEKLKALKRQTAAAKTQHSATLKKGKVDDAKTAKRRISSKQSTDEGADATEAAKRRLMSGKLKIEKVEEKQTFKRSKVLERKRKDSESSSAPGSTLDGIMQAQAKQPRFGSPTHNNSTADALTRHFVSSGVVGGGNPAAAATPANTGTPPRAFHHSARRVKVLGFDLTDDKLRSLFQPFGAISDLFLDNRRKHATVEFEQHRQATDAIAKMDGFLLNGNPLRVTMDQARPGGAAGNRPNFNSNNKFGSPPPNLSRPPPPVVAAAPTGETSPFSSPPPSVRQAVSYEDNMFD